METCDIFRLDSYLTHHCILLHLNIVIRFKKKKKLSAWNFISFLGKNFFYVDKVKRRYPYYRN